MVGVGYVKIYRLRAVSTAALDFDSILPLAFRRCPQMPALNFFMGI